MTRALAIKTKVCVFEYVGSQWLLPTCQVQVGYGALGGEGGVWGPLCSPFFINKTRLAAQESVVLLFDCCILGNMTFWPQMSSYRLVQGVSLFQSKM